VGGQKRGFGPGFGKNNNIGSVRGVWSAIFSFLSFSQRIERGVLCNHTGILGSFSLFSQEFLLEVPGMMVMS
jgi:hypothetical protein